MNNFREKANFIWGIANLLRGHYKQSDYGKVILPFTVLRRLDLILEPTKKRVLDTYQKHKDKKPEVLEPILNNAAKATNGKKSVTAMRTSQTRLLQLQNYMKRLKRMSIAKSSPMKISGIEELPLNDLYA